MKIFTLLIALLSFSDAAHSAAVEITAPTFVQLAKECPTGAVEKCSAAYFTKMTEGLCVDAIKAMNPAYWPESRKLQPIPKYQTVACPPSDIYIADIRFMQDSASGVFQDNKRDIIELARQIQKDPASIEKLPKIEVWQDEQGRIWTINHRRLIAMILSGIVLKIPVIFADEATVQKNRHEFTTTTNGKTINIWLTDQLGLVVSNKNRCAEQNACLIQK